MGETLIRDADRFAKKVRADRQSLLWLLFGCLALVLLFAPTTKSQESDLVTAVTANPNPFDQIEILAKAALVLDAKTGEVLFSKNGDSQLPLASLTKIMTAVTALSLVPGGTIIPIEKSFLSQEGDSGFLVDESFDLRKLLTLTLTESSNDGAYAVAAVAGATLGNKGDTPGDVEAFVERMNRKARELGLTQTYFLNPTGLDMGTEIAGGYGSALDLARLTAFAIKNYPEIFESTATREFVIKSEEALIHDVKNTNAFVDEIPNAVASKTGFTDLAGGNLVVAFNADFDRPIIVTVLGSTRDGRFTDTKALAWASLKKLSEQN